MKFERIIICMLISFIIVMLCIIDPNLFNVDGIFTIPTIILLCIIVILIIILLLLKKFKPTIYDKILNIFFEVDDGFDGEKYIEDLRNKIIHSSLIITNKQEEKNTDILELMLENMKEIRDYYVISKRQAKNAFSLAISMCILGFIFIAISIILSAILNLSFAISLIPAVAGAIAEVIAGTSLIVYKTSLEQLNNYYESLHNNERFLSLVNLVNKISENKQDEVYTNIINVELQNYRHKN